MHTIHNTKHLLLLSMIHNNYIACPRNKIFMNVIDDTTLFCLHHICNFMIHTHTHPYRQADTCIKLYNKLQLLYLREDNFFFLQVRSDPQQ